MRIAVRAGAALAATVLLALGAPPAPAADLVLPKPLGDIPVPPEAFPDRPERLRTSIVPGRVDDTERVEVALAPDGSPAAVTMTQRLVLRGTGQFIVWERSSAQDVEALEDTTAPVLKREAVIWQGFVDGSKTLAARLTLDPAVEAQLLPFRVELDWRGPGRIGPGGALPGPGEVVVRLRNVTARGVDLPTGTVADPASLVAPLEALARAGRSLTPVVPPAAGRGLPLSLPARETGAPRNVAVPAPLRVRGAITAPGAEPAGPLLGATRVTGGIGVNGVLQGDVEFVLRVAAAGRLALDLTAFPTVDPRPIEPPGDSWRAWAARRPSATEARQVTDALVRAAAESARAHEYAPYLGHHGRGTVVTSFHVAMAEAAVEPAAAAPLRPKPLPLALASFALLGVVANATAIWRRL
ncbi:MAG TPA: hypothetical protein VF519_00405 [Mycobacteriales bacterium]|jgi:hypothetical protein